MAEAVGGGSAARARSPFARALAERMHAAQVWVAEGVPPDEALALAGPAMAFEPLGGVPVMATDGRELVDEAHARKLLLVADDTNATFAISTPLLRGADLVLEPLDELAGASDGLLAVGVRSGVELPCALAARLAEAAAGPARQATLLEALDGFERRVRAVCDAAHAVAAYLNCHPAAGSVRYPGLAHDPSHAAAARALHHGFGRAIDLTLAEGWRLAEPDGPVDEGLLLRRTSSDGAGACRITLDTQDAASVASALERLLVPRQHA